MSNGVCDDVCNGVCDDGKTAVEALKRLLGGEMIWHLSRPGESNPRRARLRTSTATTAPLEFMCSFCGEPMAEDGPACADCKPELEQRPTEPAGPPSGEGGPLEVLGLEVAVEDATDRESVSRPEGPSR